MPESTPSRSDQPPAETVGSDGYRLVVGCMSGTSLDGIDVAIVKLRGSGRALEVDVVHADERPWPDDIRDQLLQIADPTDPASRVGASELSRLHAALADVYADAIRAVVESCGLSVQDIDAVGNHGQTVFHDPAAGHTLQLGDPSRLAHLLQTTVVGDFRQGDMALGGEGAPLVPYTDWALFTHERQHRLLLNLGGIANVTSLPPQAGRDEVLAFDTGPANMLIDAMAAHLLGTPFDDEGRVADAGRPDEEVVGRLLQDAWFDRMPPKSTGREVYGAAYVEKLLSLTAHLDTPDRMATTTALTSRSVAAAVNRFIPGRPDVMWVSGGGVHNRAIMRDLEVQLHGVEVASLAVSGFDPDVKEALCFAVLAHEALNGVATGMPSVTGARGRAFSGKICPAGTTHDP